MSEDKTDSSIKKDFIRAIVDRDLETGKHDRPVTRFPPEPNGYPHIGHAKAICLNFGIAEEYAEGVCHLRFDDTNPETEDLEYVRAIQEDVRWLGYDWGDNLFFASDYFERLYECALKLVREGNAYVDELDEAQIREYRGTVLEPGRPSPYRDRPVAENLRLLEAMKNGDLDEGAAVLRAKGDLAHSNMKMRDPLIYRIRKAHHYRRGDDWCIFPFYDFAHCLSDYFEGITHSLCTLEFENNRVLYEWYLEKAVPAPHPRQIEFARLNLTYTVMSKRRLLKLVQQKLVTGWDDPRMPTLRGLRRRGYTPRSIRTFCDRIGITKANSLLDVAQLEHAIRDDLNQEAPRVLAVLRPLKVVIENWEEGRTEALEAPFWPHDVPKAGSRSLTFGREIFIEQEDFMEDPPRGYHRLSPGEEVRLRYAFLIRCREVIRNERGEVIQLNCTYDPDSRGGVASDGRKVKGTLHWVSAENSLKAEIRLYDRLFRVENPNQTSEGTDFLDYLNPNSLEVLKDSRVEDSLGSAEAGQHFQFERQGYFVVDAESGAEGLVFNRTVTLRDSWAKIQSQPEASSPSKEKKKVPSAPAPERSTEDREAIEAFRRRFAVGEEEAWTLLSDPNLLEFFEEAVPFADSQKSLAGWMVSGLRGLIGDRPLESLTFAPVEMAHLANGVDRGRVSRTAGKEILEILVQEGGEVEQIVQNRGLEILEDPTLLLPIVESVLARSSKQVEAYRAGKTSLFGYFVGQVMKETKGKARALTVQSLLRELLDSSQ